MIDALKQLEEEAKREVGGAPASQLSELKVKYLGRKGLFASVCARISEVPPDQKRLAGQEMNRVKQSLEAIFASGELSAGPAAEEASKIDTTMPGTFFRPGRLHPLTLVMRDVAAIFGRLGFALVDGPEA